MIKTLSTIAVAVLTAFLSYALFVSGYSIRMGYIPGDVIVVTITLFVIIVLLGAILIIGKVASQKIHGSGVNVSEIEVLVNDVDALIHENYGISFLQNISSTSPYNKLARKLDELSVKLGNSYASLEQMVDQRTAELNDAKLKLERQTKALVNVLEDLSEEKEFKETESKLLLETIGEAIVITKDDGTVSYVNNAFVRMFGYKPEEMVGNLFEEKMKAYNLKDEPLSPEDISNTAAITAQGEEAKVLFEKKSGEKHAIIINAAPIYQNEEFKGIIRVMHDFTEDLKLRQQKDDFFSIASHELRTPLTVISGNLDILLQGYGKSTLSKEDTAILEDTITASDRLIRMVNDFLNVSRIDQGRLKYDIVELDACELVNSVTKELKPLAEKKGLSLQSTCPADKVLILADEGLMKEIIINLVGNSIKFTSEGGITLLLQHDAQYMYIDISDTGAGIAKDKQSQLFQRFQQAMDRTLAREAGGTGLGLYISREFARKMGGDLTLAHSELGKGATFQVKIPISTPEAQEALLKSSKENKA